MASIQTSIPNNNSDLDCLLHFSQTVNTTNQFEFEPLSSYRNT